MNQLRNYFNKNLKQITKLYTRSNATNATTSNISVQKQASDDKTNKIDPQVIKNVGYFEKYSKHRAILPVYDLEPAFNMGVWIAPNATLGNYYYFLIFV